MISEASDLSKCVLKFKVPSDPASQPISGFDMEKVTTTLKQFVRDWSDEVPVHIHVHFVLLSYFFFQKFINMLFLVISTVLIQYRIIFCTIHCPVIDIFFCDCL